MKFFVGMHHPHNAHRVPAACVSINTLLTRKSPFVPPDSGWMMDSGAFTIVNKHGGYPESVVRYAARIVTWAAKVPGLQIAVSQDYMCEPFVLAKTGLTVAEHQRLTIKRFDELVAALDVFGCEVPIMPVLQGYTPEDYVAHLLAYGDRLRPGMWVGVGSVCKRNGDVRAIRSILGAIKALRPDLRLHGFGLKLTALQDAEIRSLLFSADSMSWSFAARRQGRDANSPVEARDFYDRVMALAE